MKIILAQGINDRTFRIEPETSEIKNLDGFQDLIKDTVSKEISLKSEWLLMESGNDI